MNKFLIYSGEITISLALFYIAYWLFFKNETYFKLNRFYLLFSIGLSLLIPLLNITLTANLEKDSFLAKYLILPVDQYESIIGNVNQGRPPMGRHRINSYPDSFVDEGTETKTPRNAETAISKPLQNSVQENNSGTNMNWPFFLFMIYIAGSALLLIRFVVSLVRISGYILKHKPQHLFGAKVIRFEKKISPFSFLNYIFISNEEYPEAELSKIISHEKVHIRQRHSVDILLLELLLIFQWFNPFVWLYKRAIKNTHEYLADQETLDSGINMADYQYSLLNQALNEKSFEITNSYNLFIKKRITMMKKRRSTRLSMLKLVIALPIFAFLFSAFALDTNKLKTVVTGKEPEMITDTLPKKVDVPVEYLKLLEGDYVSTNDKRVRQIYFLEVMGELIGSDNGYIYKLIPVGGEKFINPDDGATLEFNTKNKKEITLSLFGSINLKKIDRSANPPKKSIAYLLLTDLTKQGIPAATASYNEIKDSPKYYTDSYEMTFAGNQLLKAGKAKEAAYIFKLAIEKFSGSFKAYENYGTALMASGDKNQAIESYKKAVKLNPGSATSLKALKEAGIDTDTLVKKANVPMEYLKLLEGEYISTDEPNRVRKIRFALENGVLEGNDNGYHYKIMPLGDGKFINPDDGASLEFNTKNKDAITLLIFGKIHLKKLKTSEESIKKVNVSIESLKLLEGEYASINEPNIVRKIRFEVENGVLVGNDDGYRYKLIPVGEGKFVNPDDDGSFVFDTKDKNAITLLFLGKINLKKVK